MRRKAKTELGTFSASAIDLFASALGAFIIITVVLFPYFPNLSADPLKAVIEQLRADKKGLEVQVADLGDQNAALVQQNGKLTGQVSSLTGQVSTLKGKVGTLNGKVSSLTTTVQQQKGQISSVQQAGGAKDRLIADLQGQLNGTAFIGVEPESDDFQLVLDMSGSIEDYRGTVQEVVRDILSRMDSNDNLRIITYQGVVSSPTIKAWPGGASFRDGITDSDKSAAQNFVNSALNSAGGYTPTFKAMDNALGTGKPTTIILLTDGVPQVLPSDGGNGASRSTIESAVQTAISRNAGRHQVNIVAIGEFVNSEQASAIVPLATRNGGVLVAMP